MGAPWAEGATGPAAAVRRASRHGEIPAQPRGGVLASGPSRAPPRQS